jgi:predicted nucleic acid-binding protein
LSNVVLDAGVLIASVYPETLTRQASILLERLCEEDINLHAPYLLRYEVVAVSRKAVYQGRVTLDEGLRARDKLLSYPVTLHFDEALLKRGYELATTYNRPTAYDSQYLALAERLDCEFWTTDQRMFNAVKENFATIRWLGDVSLAEDSDEAP